ncbi:DNA-binding protein [Pseudomonas rhizoryzae]|uniref:DNA-binding protein n=1 Tax=Pseudomonas rhizoryzae TaxID=2571129 RepID=UPI0010C16540|nr:DNA-binding protein [Pseudomonas rhizoryzae]
MPQSKILIDTNSYLRLAREIRPFLCVEFGSACYCLYALAQLGEEILASHRLRNKFAWSLENEHIIERQRTVSLSRKERKDIQQAFDFIWDYVETDLPGPSKVDANYLAHSYVLKIPVVTDDRDMLELAASFGIEAHKSLDLLALMHSCEHISLGKIYSIIHLWIYNKDTPADMHSDFPRIFPGQKLS